VVYCGTWLQGEQEGQGLWGLPHLAGGLQSPRLRGSFPAGLGKQGGVGERPLRPRPGEAGWGRLCMLAWGESVHVHECVPLLRKGLLGLAPHPTCPACLLPLPARRETRLGWGPVQRGRIGRAQFQMSPSPVSFLLL